MNIAGVGPQIFIIFILALLLFGPRKMLQYAFQAGQIVAKLRVEWEKAMGQVQEEMKNAGFDIPVDIMNRRIDIAAEAERYINGKPSATNTQVAQTASTFTTAASALTPSETAPSAIDTETPSGAAPSLNNPDSNSNSTDEAGNKYDAWLPN